jgi:hypothetical protein
LLEGQTRIDAELAFTGGTGFAWVPNKLDVDERRILANLQKVQADNGLHFLFAVSPSESLNLLILCDLQSTFSIKMGRSVPTFRQWLNAEYQEWMKMKAMLPQEERKALKELLDVAQTRSDAGSIVPRPLPSETMFMLMLVHLKTEIDELQRELIQRTAVVQ